MEDAGRVSLSGRTLAHYRISSAIGAGGMGEVYRATDTKLARDIALKVLPAEMANAPDRLARFQREARAVAALNHPNVVTVYSVEESHNVHFITMELIEGQPLDRLISGNGLPSDRIIEIAGAVAEALSAAHEKGIVHRDLKPANVMVTNEGRVKVLDFGLAKDVGAETVNGATMASAGYTQAGMVMGTPAYMSPEQVSGRPLDHRSDIFSFGVMLHEMATGRRPFEGNSSAELISSILRDNPPSVSDVRPELPSDIARVIRRCLEKEPRHRVQTARDVSNEFRDLARNASRLPISSSTRTTPTPGSGAARADEGFWVAVLPFKYSGANADLTALAEGLSDEIVTGLSRFSYLRVIARSSTARYAGQPVDVRTAGKELGARYVMEGTLRQAGAKIRIAVQLVDAQTGSHLWAENYERAFASEALFELQDDLVPRIVSTVAETQGVLPRSMAETLRTRNPDRLSPYEALLRGFAYFQQINREEHAAVMALLERAVEQTPDNSDCWALLSLFYSEGYAHGFSTTADLLGLAYRASGRAIEASPSNHLAHHARAKAAFFRREVRAFRSAAKRAIDLNPMDGFTIAHMSFLIAYSGDWEQGCGLAEKARSLNPSHPGWCWFPPFFDAYRKGDYPGALEFALKVNMPGFWRDSLARAVAYGQLGELEAAEKALQELLAVRPNFASQARQECEKWWQPELVDSLLEGLRKAGLEIPEAVIPDREKVSATTSGAVMARNSGSSRVDEGFWVGVLPFKYSGNNENLKALAEGLTEEIITGMSRFSYLRVIARSSTAKYSSESGDIRTIGKELGARYVMEGSLRQAGSKLRLAVQLVDAVSGAHLWAENYERSYTPEAVFEIQDDLVPRIVSTIADMHGALPRSMSAAVRLKPSDQLTPYEALLRGFGLSADFKPADIAEVQNCLERAVQQSPDKADRLAMLSIVQSDAYGMCDDVSADILEPAFRSAQAAVEAAPTNALCYHALAKVLFFKRNLKAFFPAAEQAIALNPMDGATTAYMGILMAFAGDWERGEALTERGMQLNANHPGWHLMTAWHDAYRMKDYQKALQLALKLHAPKNPWVQRSLTVSYAQLGMKAEAANSLRDLLALVPHYAQVTREMHSRWLEPELVEHMLEGLRKAGLEIPDESSSTVAQGSTSFGATHQEATSGAIRADEGFWVAVLPFKYAGKNDDLKALAEGLSEEVVTGLSRFSYLRVIARGSTAKFSSESGDVRTIGRELGARYVMEGSLRHAGSKLRLAVQLADATTGSHVWAETYERLFNPETVFELQDELVPRIVSTVADAHGILPHTMGESIRSKSPDQLGPYEAVLRCFSYAERISSEEHAIARDALERAVEISPNYAYAWALLALCIKDEFESGFNPKPDPLERMLKAARRAVDLDPSGHRGYHALALAHFYRKEIPAFRTAADRAIALNPLDGCNVAHLGSFIAYAGEWERGCGLVERALQLNPNHPGWFWFPLSMNAYRKGDYQAALGYALKINLPNFLWSHTMLAAIYGQLGQPEEAGKAVQELLKLNPQAAQIVRAAWQSRYDPELVNRLIEGLRKAGLDVGDEAAPSPALSSGRIATRSASGESRASDGFWVALLPFKYTGSSAELKSLAEGLTDEITTGLSRFSYLRVIARGSTAKYSSESRDVRAIGKELGARYVMEGSLRQAGSKLRLTVQLADTVTGTHVWAETYERAFTPDAIFDLQDDLVPSIVATVADQYGVLPRSIGEVLRSKSEDSLTPDEAVLRTFSYFGRIGAEEHAVVRRILERAVRETPDHADCWAMLSMAYRGEFAQGYNARPNSLDRALAAAQRAVDLAPTNGLCYYALATVHYFRKEIVAFRATAERSLALNPMDGSAVAYLGMLIATTGEWDRGCAMVESAMKLNPNCPSVFQIAMWANAYRQGKYEESLEAIVRANLPGYFHAHAARAATLGKLGRKEEAQKALQELLALRPDFATVARQEYAKWYDAEHIEQMIDGLRKAGLEINDEQTSALEARSSQNRLQ